MDELKISFDKSMETRKKIQEMGWNISSATKCWEEDGYYFFEVMPDDVTGYTVQINPETGSSRHIGNGAGCFWTAWR